MKSSTHSSLESIHRHALSALVVVMAFSAVAVSAATTDLTVQQCQVFSETMESGALGWTHGTRSALAKIGDPPGPDTWHLGATTCFGDSLDSTMFLSNGNAGSGCQADSARDRSQLVSPAITLPADGVLDLQFDALSFDEAGSCGSSATFDKHDVGLSVDGGLTYARLNDCTALTDGTGAVLHRQYDISAFAGQTVRVVFAYDTVDENSGHTFAIDNVVIVTDQCGDPVCGDGIVNPDEECDDGNTVDGDGCSGQCMFEARCGDGTLDPGEACDDGNTVGGDGCAFDCTVEPFCGDGNVDPGEFCDDGNGVDGDGCAADCTVEPLCGNGLLEGGEACDDGNTSDGDGCAADCTIEPDCGNGVVETGEACDDGNAVDGDGCAADCTIEPFCGDGNLDPTEQCDDGNNQNGDGCNGNCTIEDCGNGRLEAGEQCDDGNTTDGDGCAADCTWEAFCGDGNLDPGEQCDDGNFNHGDGCTPDCELEGECGDGVVNPGEECDDGNDVDDDVCSNSCEMRTCTVYFENMESGADGWTHFVEGGPAKIGAPPGPDTWHVTTRTCRGQALGSTMYVSNGNDGPLCEPNSSRDDSRLLSPPINLPVATMLQLSFDAISYDEAGACTASATFDKHDVGVTTDAGVTYTLLNDCTALADGRGGRQRNVVNLSAWAGQRIQLIFAYDTVDESAGHTFAVDDVKIVGDACGVDAVCGNGELETGETCDDGNTVDGDGCSAECRDEALCGDGTLDPDEDCDDGNTEIGDGCRSDCTIESCGDGIVDPGESCDDGNAVDGDGCSAACAREPYCGNGAVDPGEECDDGNAIDDDRCSNACAVNRCTAYQEDMEGEAPGWTHSRRDPAAKIGDPPGPDTWHQASTTCRGQALGSTMFLSNGNDGPACTPDSSRDHSQLLSPMLQLPPRAISIDLRFDALSFDEAGTCTGSASFDKHDVGITTDGGASYTLLNDCTALADGAGGVFAHRYDVSGWAGERIQFVFVYDTVDDTGGHTFAIDDVAVMADDCSYCGDGLLDAGEVCDDGNGVAGDGCRADCTEESCGDGIVDPQETCDDMNQLPGDGCRANCTIEICGDGIADPGEVCDDGNTVGGDGCRSDCTVEICGDGIVDPGETCDDGNVTGGDGCRANCTAEICGDGIVDPGETCDDGNVEGGDGCRADCTDELCGDGIVDPGETCDDGNLAGGDGCRANCTEELCGDAIVDPGEVCDDGNTVGGDGCRADCTIESCGDEVVDPGETCDDGNTVGGDGCRADCTAELCGDAVLDPQEVCDDGNTVGGDGCRADCTEELCGDSIRDPGEECDDGNTLGGDGCRADCTEELCGDGIVDPTEECDDGNNVDGDRCFADCTLEPFCGDAFVDPDEQCDEGEANSDLPDADCRSDCTDGGCGDGILDSAEECDDGNTLDGDGCQSTCRPTVCGDGILDPGEECDDGNDVESDGCNNRCENLLCTVFSDSMETGAPGWSSTGLESGDGRLSVLPTAGDTWHLDSTTCRGDALDSTMYVANGNDGLDCIPDSAREASRLLSPPIVLPADAVVELQFDALSFDEAGECLNGAGSDRHEVGISVDGGVSWVVLNDCSPLTTSAGVEGHHRFDISAWAGQTVQIVFAYDTGTSTGGHTFAIDNVVVFGLDCSDTLLATGSASVDHRWRTVPLPFPVSDPVVIAGPATNNGNDPGGIRLRNIDGDTFEARFEEWNYLNGIHGRLESFAWLALPRGRHVMPDGSVWEAGTFEITGLGEVATPAFEQSFASRPALFLTVQGRDFGPVATPRVVDVSAAGFAATLVSEELLAKTRIGTTVIVGYLAVHSPASSGRTTANGAVTPYLLQQAGIDHRFTPLLSWNLRIDEERSADNELVHATEDITALAIGSRLFAQNSTTNEGDAYELRRIDVDRETPLEWGIVRGVTDRDLIVPLQQTYDHPVVIAKLASRNGSQGGVVRVFDVDVDAFRTEFQEWRYLDGKHIQEDVFYMVVEAGRHSVAGLTFEAGKLRSSSTAIVGGFESVVFSGAFDRPPALFAAVQTREGTDPVATRMRNRAESGFELTMQEEEDGNQRHGVETLGWVAIERGLGRTPNGRAFEVFDEWVNHRSTRIEFTQSYRRAFPTVVGDVMTFRGTDPITMRWLNVMRGWITLFLQEEQSSDAEIVHLLEQVSVFVAE